jgi:hypothetical protein
MSARRRYYVKKERCGCHAVHDRRGIDVSRWYHSRHTARKAAEFLNAKYDIAAAGAAP